MIDTCVNCDYSLKGLPANHRCPECGVTYDEKSEVYRVDSYIRAFEPLAYLFGGLLLFSGAVRLVFTLLGLESYNRDVMPIVYGAGATIGLLWVIWNAWGIRRRGQLVAILPEHAYLRLDRVGGQLIPWEDVQEVIVVSKPIGVRLRRRKSREFQDLYRVFRKLRDAENFAQRARERIAARPRTQD